MQNLAQQQISGLGRLGGVQQAQSQAVLDAQRQAAQTQAYEPYQRLGTYGSGVASLISGYPGSTQVTQTPKLVHYKQLLELVQDLLVSTVD